MVSVAGMAAAKDDLDQIQTMIDLGYPLYLLREDVAAVGCEADSAAAGAGGASLDVRAVEDKDNIEALLDDADRLSSTISRPFSGLSTVLARIRAASIAQKKELHATLEVVKALTEVCQQRHATLEVVKEALKADAPKQIVSVKKEPTEVGDPPRLASHADYPAKRSRPSPSASSGASSGAAGGAAGGAAKAEL